MKWPATLTMIRHSESDYNVLKAAKEADPDYQIFLAAYEDRKKNPEIARKLAEVFVINGRHILGVGDHDTGITPNGEWQAETTGAKLRQRGEAVPDVILVSPYKRTLLTLANLSKGWPELSDVVKVEDERLREQEHGLSIIYNDWRIFHVLHPEQERLRDLSGPYWYRYPQGESVPDVRERNRSMIGTLTRDYAQQRVMIITHHLNILATRANLERLDEHGYQHLDDTQKPVNLGVTTYVGDPNQGNDGHLNLETYNEQLY